MANQGGFRTTCAVNFKPEIETVLPVRDELHDGVGVENDIYS